MQVLLLGLTGLVVGVTVGMTGMGGGALMTPILVVGFGVPPISAVSSDLVASVVMKPLGAAVHARRGSLHRPVVTWLCMGSVPAALSGAFALHLLGDASRVQDRIGVAVGVALLLATAAIGAKAVIVARRPGLPTADVRSVPVRPLPTLAVGVLGGLVVGTTSVGSGSLMFVLLLVLYPSLSTGSLVGTDLAQAIPLVGAAAIGHLAFGDVSLALTGSLLLGAVPGVYLGARYSATAPDGVMRGVLAVALALSALKLLGVPTVVVAWLAAGAVLAGAAWSRGRRRPGKTVCPAAGAKLGGDSPSAVHHQPFGA